MKNKEAIIHFNGKTLLTSGSYLDVKAYEHALAFTVAKMIDEDLLKNTRDLITKSLETGTTFSEFKKQLKPLLSADGWGNMTDNKAELNRRLKTIYHTNLQTAYSAGQWERIQQTKQFLPYLQYMPSMSENKRLEHKKFYNIVRPVDDPIWQSISPPNGYGCRCWIKQISKTKAEKIGISDPVNLDMETVENPRTGEMMTTPKGVHFSFNHNHDRLTALLKLATDKHGTEFGERLRKQVDELMIDLIFQPDFTRNMITVGSVAFATRFNELQSVIVNANRENSMELRKTHAKGEVWAVATISPQIQKTLDVETAIVWLSDDTVIKMIVHHPELDLLPLFKDVQMILKNAVKVVKKDDLNVIYFSVQDKHYIATVKATRDKKELYLTTIYAIKEKDFVKQIRKYE